jgi:hypothetical protein
MSWSYKILILYLGFMGIILTLVFTCFGEKNELEAKDYYARELVFQEQINAAQNAKDLDTPIAHSVAGRTVTLNIPSLLLTADFKGEAQLFRPSDSSLDRMIGLKPDADGTCVITDASLVKGVYRIRISIVSNNTPYYKEEVITLR